ncbi:MAG TPA: STM3941 family protein [Allosphingosinicella sp.]|nr:STM3941 family protein [Allosphingosinicella sp.]
MAERFVARKSIWRLGLIVGGALLFVVAGLWVAGLFGQPPRPGREWLGWLCVVFFGLCALVGLRRLAGQSEQIVIDEHGVLFRQWSRETIPWSAILAYAHRSVRAQEFICLELEDPARFPRSTAGGFLLGLNTLLGYGDVALNVGGTDRGFRELAEAFSRHAPPRLSKR